MQRAGLPVLRDSFHLQGELQAAENTSMLIVSE